VTDPMTGTVDYASADGPGLIYVADIVLAAEGTRFTGGLGLSGDGAAPGSCRAWWACARRDRRAVPHDGHARRGARHRVLHDEVQARVPGMVTMTGLITEALLRRANGGITACAETAQIVARQVAERYPADLTPRP
jgi:hypothetical protein